MKLHVGCGNVIISGWSNLDIEKLPGVDIQDDIKTLEKIEDGSCDIIYASHVLEHVGRNEFGNVLKTWNKKLKMNGVLRVAVPDFEKAIEWYTKTNNILDIVGLVSGGQKSDFDYHQMIYDKKYLTEVLEKCGFADIHEWNWRETEHNMYDDYSQSYLPHMDKENGMLMSLNLEGKKNSELNDDEFEFGKSPWREK